MSQAVFHLALPARDLEQTRAFYCAVLGAVPGRATPEWIDLMLFGHQVTFHQRPEQVAPLEAQGVLHFGAVLPWSEWEALGEAVVAAGCALLVAPIVLHPGTRREQGKLRLRDPSGYLLEFKAYRHPATVLAGAGAAGEPTPAAAPG